eukprot:34788-Pyramimonas_sp.AAC.1
MHNNASSAKQPESEHSKSEQTRTRSCKAMKRNAKQSYAARPVGAPHGRNTWPRQVPQSLD